MSFPFSIKYVALINENINEKNAQLILNYIKNFIEQKTADNIVIKDNTLSFKSSFFKPGRWNTNILVPIEKGVFQLFNEGNNSMISYEIFMYHLFIGTILISVFMAIFSGLFWVGFIAFFWLGVMNWIVALIRHKRMLIQIALNINQTFVKDNT